MKATTIAKPRTMTAYGLPFSVHESAVAFMDVVIRTVAIEQTKATAGHVQSFSENCLRPIAGLGGIDIER